MAISLRTLNELWGQPKCAYMPNLDFPIGHICTDSRKLMPGDFFVPLIGEKFNGHLFIQHAFELGAQATVVVRDCGFSVPNEFLHWIVDDTLTAYQQLGLLNRFHINIPVVAVTGSTGKTTTRELIRSALAPLGNVLCSAENNNNDVGVPLTLLQGSSDHAAMVVEMGMRSTGEIQRLSFFSQPNIAVITNIGSAHLGRLGSRSAIAKAKCEITSGLPSTGVVVIPAGDLLLEEALRRSWNGRVIRVALQEDFAAKDSDNFNVAIDRDYSFGVELIGRLDLSNELLVVDGQSFNLPLAGKHNARNLLLALAVAKELGVSLDKLKELNVMMPAGRSSQLQLGGITVLDETYNSSPEAVYAALELLITIPGRHFAVLGKMLELGEHSVDLHRDIARKVVKLGLDGLVIVAANGPEAAAMATEAASLPNFVIVSTPEEAAKPLDNWLKSGDVLLLKASRNIRLERLLPFLAEAQE